MSLAVNPQFHNALDSRVNLACGPAMRCGFAANLFLAAVVTSLCGAWIELLTRKYDLPVNPTQVLLLTSFIAMAMRPGSRFEQSQFWLAGAFVFLVSWGSIGVVLEVFPNWDAYQKTAVDLAIGTTIAFCCIWLPRKDETLRRFGLFSSIGLCVMAAYFMPYVLDGSHPPGPRIRDWHIHGGIARMPWTLDDPNMFSSNLLVLIIACFYCWRTASTSHLKWLCLAGLTSGCALMLLSMSRAGIGGLILAVAAYSLFSDRRSLAIAIVVGVAAITVAAMTPAGEYVLARFTGALDSSSTSVRIQQYLFAFDLGLEKPFGVGLGQSLELAKANVYYRIHSSVMEPFAELGLFGFVLISGLLGFAVYRWLRLGSLINGITNLCKDTNCKHEWILFTSLLVGMGFVAPTIPITNRTSLWLTIGLTCWFASGIRQRLRQSHLVVKEEQTMHMARRVA
jgi:multisubunit Na+/H+ antiporter MnhG subunit